jgi:GH24 family phage-related lysozyme (muramidase)
MQQSVVQNYTNFADNIQTEVTPNQFAALTSFEYNLGSGVWNTSTGQQILSLINQGRNEDAGRLMLQYNKARNPQTGELQTNRVLAQRRMREANLLLS